MILLKLLYTLVLRLPQVWSANGVSEPDNSVVKSSFQIKKYFKNLKLDTIYNAGNSATYADITSGALWLLWGTNITATNNNYMPTIDISTRVRFYDS